jgi:DNA-binding protein H-NS
MSSLKDLIAQRAELERQIEEMGRQERSDAISKVRALMADHGLSASDLAGGRGAAKTATSKGSKVAAKYRNNDTGETWSGRGLQPKWLKSAIAAGKKIEDFSV